MTSRKPQLNLLYATDCATRRLQLAVVIPSQSSARQHARQWQAARLLLAEANDSPSESLRKH